MESPYFAQIQKLSHSSRVCSLLAVIFYILTLVLVFVPGLYFEFTMAPAVILTIICLYLDGRITHWKTEELWWKLDHNMKTLMELAEKLLPTPNAQPVPAKSSREDLEETI